MPTRTTAARRTTTKAKKAAPRARAVPPPKGAATIADLRRIARAIVTSTSVHDEKRMLGLYADSVESQEAGQMPTYGIEAIKQKNEQWNRMVSDVRWHARNLWCDGQTIIIEWEAQITLRPGGRKVLLNEIAVHEVRSGKIVRERFYYDPSVLR
ncbi:MAG TPA: nuclear transport factor 2 family protein [Candidatus Binatia bacterium]|nr:nuclear transport factor 2 family protein [Candidatus Binatia bacterium]